MRSELGGKLPGQDSPHRNSLSGQAEETHRETLSHARPTSQTEDPDLALIVGIWDRLADECKQQLIEMVRANMPRQCDADEFDEINERGE
jgi:hypothetical protein